jgi:hypothetical protein
MTTFYRLCYWAGEDYPLPVPHAPAPVGEDDARRILRDLRRLFRGHEYDTQPIDMLGGFRAVRGAETVYVRVLAVPVSAVEYEDIA